MLNFVVLVFPPSILKRLGPSDNGVKEVLVLNDECLTEGVWDMYERLAQASEKIQSYSRKPPRIGIVLGSGLGAFVGKVQNPVMIPYEEIPYFQRTSVEGHEGRLIMGELSGVQVAILQGRLHAYEGVPMEEVVFPVRTLATLGCESLILTNASGGVNEQLAPGDLVVIKDHINFMGKNPLVGPNITELGPRFPDMTQAYDPSIIDSFFLAAKKMNLALKSGVYGAVLGPTYETPAEVRMLRTLGVDMVGMSTVPESIAANHLGLKVGGVSCVTNLAAGLGIEKLKHEDVKAQAKKVMESFSKLLELTIEQIGKNDEQ